MFVTDEFNWLIGNKCSPLGSIALLCLILLEYWEFRYVLGDVLSPCVVLNRFGIILTLATGSPPYAAAILTSASSIYFTYIKLAFNFFKLFT